MLSKAHLTSHSRMSGSRSVITPSWLSSSTLDHYILIIEDSHLQAGVGSTCLGTIWYDLCWDKIHGRRSLVGCSPWGHEELGTTEWLHFHFSLSCIGEGNGNPLQCSCLENPRDGGTWWAAVSGVTQSWTWLKQLSSSSTVEIIKFSTGLCLLISRRLHFFFLKKLKDQGQREHFLSGIYLTFRKLRIKQMNLNDSQQYV